MSEWDPSKLIQNEDFDSRTCKRDWVVLSVMFALHGGMVAGYGIVGFPWCARPTRSEVGGGGGL